MKTKAFNSFRRLYVTTALVTSMALAHPAASYALSNLATPTGGVVVGGSSSISSPSAGILDITQSTARSVINWGTFNIGAEATTQFFQPGTSSLSIERVASGNPAQIMGTLKANGNVMILDGGGVLFGKNSVVDVSGIVASTGNVSTAQVMSGASTIQIQNMGNATVENQGAITVTDMGLAAFVAPTVRNSGTITANLGQVAFGAAKTATVDLCGDGLMSIAVNGNLNHALIENSGNIIAHGGQITMTTRAASNIVDNAINNTGIVEAMSMTAKGGQIILSGGKISAGGTLDASGATGGGTISLNSSGSSRITGTVDANGNFGGTIDVTGNDVDVAGKVYDLGTAGIGGLIHLTASQDARVSGTIDATGLEGGGTIFINGGNRVNVSGSVIAAPVVVDGSARAPALPPGQITLDAPTVLFSGLLDVNGFDGGGNVTLTGGRIFSSGDIEASSTLQHNGGQIIFSGTTLNDISAGTLTATGGPSGGNGGTVTVDKPDIVSPSVVVNVSAPAGTAGTYTH